MKKSDIFGFMLLTLGLGIVTGILIAPKSGKETRKDLSEKFEKCFEEACDFLTYESGRIKSKVNDAADYFKSKLNDES
ncbi:MAG: YtxH domain-containing protein [Cyanobacteria bacterium]|nr:YtxH domain-containing protein [Cyanobacteriota bacterium]